MVKAHIQSVKHEQAVKEARKQGLDIAAIPERADDPFGLLEKTQVSDPL